MMRKAAHLLAIDVGGVNQEGCANARVVYEDLDELNAAIPVQWRIA